jgi:hypothetical protein
MVLFVGFGSKNQTQGGSNEHKNHHSRHVCNFGIYNVGTNHRTYYMIIEVATLVALFRKKEIFAHLLVGFYVTNSAGLLPL